jgi:hypothetical protein
MYWTVPAVKLEGLISAWLMVDPEPALAPVIPPEITPIVHVNVLGVLAVNAMFGLAPLQMVAVAGFVTAGFGLTVTVIVYGCPAHDPVVDVGVTKYCTVPAAELLGLVRVWLIVVPDPAVAPVIPPVIVPTVQLNELDAVAVSAMFGLVALQIELVAAVVTAGVGLTVIVIV